MNRVNRRSRARMRAHHISIINSTSESKTDANTVLPFITHSLKQAKDDSKSSDRLLDAFDLKFECNSISTDAADWLLTDKLPALNQIIGAEITIEDCLATADRLTSEIDKIMEHGTSNIESHSFSSSSSSSMSSFHITNLDENVFKEDGQKYEDEKGTNQNHLLIKKCSSSAMRKSEITPEAGGCIVGIDEQAECAEKDFLLTSKMVDSLIEDIENELLLKSDSETHTHSYSQSRTRSHSSKPQSNSLSSSYRSRSSSRPAALMAAFLLSAKGNRYCLCKKKCSCACHTNSSGLTRTCSNNSLEWDVSIDEIVQASGNKECKQLWLIVC
jgi:hypothetical protein